MAFDTKALKTRIKSVDSTLHLTKAMGLVASSKIRKANSRMFAARQYADAVNGVVDLLTVCPECKKSPFITPLEGGQTVLIVIAGDRGLAGGYNANIFRTMRELNADRILPIGKRACERYGDGYPSAERFTSAEAAALAGELCDGFLSGEISRVGIVSTAYISIMSQEPVVSWVLPLCRKEDAKQNGVLFEPDESRILSFAVREYLAGRLVGAVRESFASEVSARRMAMDSAGKNAGQMIDDLTLRYNRARQGAITQEITEIVAGSGT